MPNKLELIQDFPFEFYGEMYVTHLANDRQFYIRLNDICDAMGLLPAAQRRRIQEDEGISHYLVNILADTPYQGGVRRQEVGFLNIQGLPYWLGTIDAKRVRPEVYDTVVRFKRSFAETAWQVYRSDLMPPEVLAEMDAYEGPERAELGQAMDRIRGVTKRLDQLEGRLTVIEARMSSEAIINVRQQWQIKTMIEFVGEALYESNGGKMPKTQCHALTQNDFKRQFQLPVYSLLPASQMEDAITYLTHRYQHFKPGVKLPQIFIDGSQQSLI